jgi:hypothetical protein
VLRELLKRRRAEIAERWFQDALSAYPSRAVDAWCRERDPFANPVGHALREGTRAVLDAVVDGTGPAAVRDGLGETLKIRAIQEMAPSVALAFVFRLKPVIRAELGQALGNDTVLRELAELEAAIDQAALTAFDLYVEHRERLVELRIAELKRNIPWAVARAELAAAGSHLPEEGT